MSDIDALAEQLDAAAERERDEDLAEKALAYQQLDPKEGTISLEWEGGSMSDYDSRPETQAHIDRVGDFLNIAIDNLGERAEHHDASKLVSPEVEAFDIATPKLAQLVYGSPEYKQSTDDLGPALEHHYENNDHHPQYFPNGVQGMSLMALIEMLCDWRAASERSKQRTDDPEKVKTFADGLAYQQERFGYSDEVAEILLNTVKELGL